MRTEITECEECGEVKDCVVLEGHEILCQHCWDNRVAAADEAQAEIDALDALEREDS